MSIFKSEYTINIDKSIDEAKALFEKHFKDMGKKGYSTSTVILNSDYGRKKFTGTIDNDGTYNARLIVSKETDEFYRSALLNKISFTGDSSKATVNVAVKTEKFAVLFIVLLVISVLIMGSSFIATGIPEVLFPILLVGIIFLLISFIPLIISNHRVNAAKEELIYILKYSNKL